MCDQEITYHLESALSYDPHNQEILKLSCLFYLDNEDFKKVRSILQCFESESESEYVLFIKSLLAFKKKEYQEASQCIAKCIRLNPSIEYLTKGQEIESYNGDTENLSTYLNLLVEKDSQNGWHYYALAKFLDIESEFQRIFYLIETSISLLPKEEKPLILKYNILIDYSDLLKETPYYKTDIQIFDDFGKLLEKYPLNNDLSFFIAKINYQKKRYDEAIDILENNVEPIKSFNLLGDCYFKKKNFKKALEYFSKTNPSGNNAFFLSKKKGMCSLKLNKHSHAKKHFLECYELFYDLQRKYDNDYKHCVSKNQFGEAKKFIIKKNKAKLYMSNICLALHKFKTLPIQKDFLQLALNINNQNSHALLEMGLLHKENCTQEALVYFLKSAQYDWDNMEAHKQLSVAYKELGQLQNHLLHKKIIEQDS